MIIGIKWRGFDDAEKAELVNSFTDNGFAKIDDGRENSHDEKLWFHYGDDMLIIDLQNNYLYSGDWGTKTDLEVTVDYVRSFNYITD